MNPPDSPAVDPADDSGRPDAAYGRPGAASGQPGAGPAVEAEAEHLPSVALAMVEDLQRAEQARQALAEAGEIQTWSVRFGLLGDENRLKILLSLHRAPGITVSVLAAAVGMSDNATSHALSALRIAGVVGAARDGRFRRWSITDPEIHDILHAVGASHSTLHPHH